MKLEFVLNGRPLTLEADPGTRVIDLLRRELELTGVKEACGSGECGACSILVDGRQLVSCLMLAGQLQGREVTTIEGLAPPNGLHPLQEEFVARGAVQCGFCTPGMLMAGAALLKNRPDADENEIKKGISGNICRCTGYIKIVEAIEAAQKRLKKGAVL
ncbi:(2Fe-2S)-binding protein [Dethiosulfatarculus sandiegensis]|uniref:(2Fe-2S)-binding protein n=1 Tax=Dethiosulfatarculus sandiegensis TaxID=1429043 RepID=A0A0D2IXW4_9BACT|nr:(2Fe-2S)-binding protein [Dethiosulfatarculus sandiegensis]KIX10879.1 (2Fe-2S)-binding protein [Dethiosulfatarculus sandiegensis]